MNWVQYEVWGSLDGHEELIECVGTLKEAELVVEDNLEFNEAMWIIEDRDDNLKEIKRYKGLIAWLYRASSSCLVRAVDS